MKSLQQATFPAAFDPGTLFWWLVSKNWSSTGQGAAPGEQDRWQPRHISCSVKVARLESSSLLHTQRPRSSRARVSDALPEAFLHPYSTLTSYSSMSLRPVFMMKALCYTYCLSPNQLFKCLPPTPDCKALEVSRETGGSRGQCGSGSVCAPGTSLLEVGLPPQGPLHAPWSYTYALGCSARCLPVPLVTEGECPGHLSLNYSLS